MYLEKEDFSLYYEVLGEGEPLLLIHGVIVDGGLYEEGAKILSRDFKVICYDRRGNSRSAFREKKQRTFTMEEQAEDIKDLLDALSIEKTSIFGASAGAAIGLFFMAKYPERVNHLIMYEPASLSLIIREDASVRVWRQEMAELIARKKYNRALLGFSESIGAADPAGRVKTTEESMREFGNIEYAMTTELPGTLSYEPDLEKMYVMRDKITIAMGVLHPETVYHRISSKLAEQIGTEPQIFPGGHNFPFEQPEKFAECVKKLLGDRQD